MEGPGLSIFQGSDSIQLNTSAQREEEEEFLEEEKIRKAELQDLINHAFGDLDDDDIDTDSSISSSRCSHAAQRDVSQVDRLRATNARYSNDQSSRLGGFHLPVLELAKDSYKEDFSNHRVPLNGPSYADQSSESNYISAHKNHCYHSNPSPIPEYDETEAYKRTDLNGTDQLQVLYEVRLREIDRLNKELEAEKEEKEVIQRKLAVSEHDRKNLEISLNANKTLLAESRTQISNLENEVSKLNQQIKDLERSKNEVRSELEITKTQLFHEQQKFAALERSDLSAKREKQYDLAIDSLKTKHRAELQDLQQQLDAALERIQKKEEDYRSLEKKLIEMEDKHSSHLLDKCDSAMRQESTVRALLDEANLEKLELTRQVNTLKQEMAMLKTDLEQYDSFRSLRLTESSSSEEGGGQQNDSLSLMSTAWRAGEAKRKSLNLNHIDIANKLKDELHRALIGQRTKRKEIMKLQEQVQAKELQVTTLKEQERLHLSQIETLKAEMNKLLQNASKSRSRDGEDMQLLAKLQSDIVTLEKENSSKSQKILSLEKEMKILTEKLTTTLNSSKSRREDYVDFYEKEIAKLKCESEMTLKDKELEWGKEMEKMMSECDDAKKMFMDIKSQKDKLSEKLKEVSQHCEEIKKEKENLYNQLLQKQQDIQRLENQILLMEKEKISNNGDSIQKIQKEMNEIVGKQTAEIKMLRSKLDDVAKADEELSKLKDEISNSKLRYIELEKTLRVEFQESLIQLKEENSLLKETLKKKEAELSLRKMCAVSQRRDISVGTEDSLIIQRREQQNSAEMERLEKEIERLRTLDEAKSQEILRLTSSHEQRLNEEVQKLEKLMMTRNQQEILLAEKKIKELSMKYFSEEMEKLQQQHAENMKTLRDEDYKKCLELQQLLARKEEELRSLNSKKDQLEAALKRYEDERTKAGLIMTQWAKEVEHMRQEKEKLNEDIEGLKLNNQEITTAYDQLKVKLKETKKAALVYKRRLQEVKTHLSEKYKKLMADLQQRVDDVVSAKEVEIRDKLQQIENEYKSKEKLLRLDCKSSEIT